MAAQRDRAQELEEGLGKLQAALAERDGEVERQRDEIKDKVGGRAAAAVRRPRLQWGVRRQPAAGRHAEFPCLPV